MSTRFHPPTNLSSLPLEILQQILSQIVPTNCTIKFRAHTTPEPNTTKSPAGNPLNPHQGPPQTDGCVILENPPSKLATELKFAHILSLLLLPPPIHALVLHLIYTTNTFHFPTPETCVAFSKHISATNRALIRSVCICANGIAIPQRSCTSSSYRFELPFVMADVLGAIAPFAGLRRLKLEGVGPGRMRQRTLTGRSGAEYMRWEEDPEYWFTDCIEAVGVLVGAVGVGDITTTAVPESDGDPDRLDMAWEGEGVEQRADRSLDTFVAPPFLKGARVVVKKLRSTYRYGRNESRRDGTRIFAPGVEYDLGEWDHEVSDVAGAIARAKVGDVEEKARRAESDAAQGRANGVMGHEEYFARLRREQTDTWRRRRLQKELEMTSGGKRDYWIEERSDLAWRQYQM